MINVSKSMEDMCTGCLSKDRKLFFIGETGYCHLYSQILNEIPVYDLLQVCVRVCWECRARLRSMQRFKQQVQKNYSDLMQRIPPKIASSLSKHSLPNISIPKARSEDEIVAHKWQSDEHCDPEPLASALSVEQDMGPEPDQDMGSEPEEDMGPESEEDMGPESEEDMGPELEQDMAPEPKEGRGPEPEEDNVKVKPLKNLLQETFEGRGLLSLYSKPGTLSNTGRRKLCNIIVKNLLETDPDRKIPNTTLLEYAQEIKTIFRKENISTYFVPYMNNTKLKIKRCAKGKLYDCFQNRKRDYRVSYKKSMDDQNNTSKSMQDSDVSDDIKWLTKSCDPWSSVEEKWKNTAEYRRTKLNNSNSTIQKYMDTYPALKKPTGFQLLMSDFKSEYPDSDNNLIVNFPLHKSKILDMTVKKYSRHSDHNLKAFTEEYVNFRKEDPITALSQETASIYAFMFLPLLLGNNVAKNKKTSWRPSKQESRDAFITHLKVAKELQATISRRKEKYATHGFTFKPTIFIVGPTLSKIKHYYVAVNDTLYRVHSIVEAVDVTFKLYYALKCEYPVDCISIYNFLQKGFYKITTKWDKEYVSVNALLADLNM